MENKIHSHTYYAVAGDRLFAESVENYLCLQSIVKHGGVLSRVNDVFPAEKYKQTPLCRVLPSERH